MSKFSIQVEKQVVMALTSIILLGSGCEDCIDTRGNTSVSEGTPVDVTFRIGLADEVDAYTLSGALASKASEPSDKASAFSYALSPAKETKATASLKPEKLYNLEIRQYRGSDGAYLGGIGTVVEEVATGSLITATLQTATKCHLVLVAWGKGNTTNRLNAVSLSEAQKVSVSSSYMDAIDPSKQEDINKMPYVLHLTDVNVKSDGSLYSADGEAIDIRLLLKRLAIRLNVDWAYNASVPGADYQLDQILLQSVPLDYKVVAAPDPKSGNTYPSLLDQFKTVQLTVAEISAGSYSCWLPANVRGTNPAATSLLYRIKSNAPTGSTYMDFQAINQNNKKQKLNYRLYLGSNDTYDFNLYGNRNYSYTVNFKHTTLPTNDLRISIIDPIPASQGNSNLVPTANCFMIAPGGAFCFNPYKFHQQGMTINNGVMQGSNWCNVVDGKIQTPIKSVKVLWQTKENGDVGDPVLGVVNSSADHANIVDLTDASDLENARIYCRVAPNTIGGNGVIAAYASTDGTGDVLWSWHIWVTDYAPDATGDETILTTGKRKLKFLYNAGAGQLPMMDRNLGAAAGYVNEVPPTPLDRSKTNGFHYQWGRKDPYPSSYSNEDILVVNDFSGNVPVKGMLNRYQADGITYFPNINGSVAITSLRNAYANPNIRYCTGSGDWCYDSNKGTLWGVTKTVNDPCPAGWKVASSDNYGAFIGQNYSSPASSQVIWPHNIKNESTNIEDGGILAYYEQKGGGNCVYLRYTGYPAQIQFGSIGKRVSFWSGSGNICFVADRRDQNTGFGVYSISTGWWRQDSHTLRCIQEQQ